MTTVAYRDGVMAADSRGYSGDRYPLGVKSKIHRRGDGALLGVSSNVVGQADLVATWLLIDTGDPDPEWLAGALGKFGKTSFTALLVAPSGVRVALYDDSPWPAWSEADRVAIGSGADFALGAMEIGASAPEAVAAAIALDPWSGWPIYVLDIHSVGVAELWDHEGLKAWVAGRPGCA